MLSCQFSPYYCTAIQAKILSFLLDKVQFHSRSRLFFSSLSVVTSAHKHTGPVIFIWSEYLRLQKKSKPSPSGRETSGPSSYLRKNPINLRLNLQQKIKAERRAKRGSTQLTPNQTTEATKKSK